MLATITEIRWNDPIVAVPAFLTLVLIPLTYSIANGLGSESSPGRCCT